MLGLGGQIAGAATQREAPTDENLRAMVAQEVHAVVCKRLLNPETEEDTGWSTTVCSAVFHSIAVQAAVKAEFARLDPAIAHEHHVRVSSPKSPTHRAETAKQKKREEDEAMLGPRPDGIFWPVFHLALFLVVGWAVFVLGFEEEWTATDAVYFAIVTMTTGKALDSDV